jgi:hypothetical protein
MTRHIPDDRRYMPYEIRAIDDARYRGKIKREAPAVETCYCGKTVVATHGNPTGWKCPRFCHMPVDERPAVRVP